MLVIPLSPSFLDTYSQSTSSLGCKALCMIIIFIVLWSTLVLLWSTSKIVPSILQGGQPKYLIMFLIYSLVSSSFLVFLSYSFWISFFISTYLMVSASNFPKYLYVSFSPNVLIFLDLIVPFIRLCVVFHSLLLAFQCQKIVFFYYCPNLVGESLVCCLKSTEFCPNFNHSFSIPSFSNVAPPIAIKCSFTIFPSPFSALLFLIWLAKLFIVCVHYRTASIGRIPSDLPCTLLRDHFPIMKPKPAVWFTRWILLRFVIVRG